MSRSCIKVKTSAIILLGLRDECYLVIRNVSSSEGSAFLQVRKNSHCQFRNRLQEVENMSLYV